MTKKFNIIFILILLIYAPSYAQDWLVAGNTVGTYDQLGSVNSAPLIFITNNIERMRITPSGFIGIGNASPIANLHIINHNFPANPGDLTEPIVIYSDKNGDDLGAFYNVGNATGGPGGFFQINSYPDDMVPALNVMNTNTKNLIFGVLGGDGCTQLGFDMSINPKPIAQLDLRSNSNFDLLFNISDQTVDNPYFDVTSDGNVGIGVNKPSSKLEVHAGDVTISGEDNVWPGNLIFSTLLTPFGFSITEQASLRLQQYGGLVASELAFYASETHPADMVVANIGDRPLVGIGTTLPKDVLQIGDRLTFSDAENKSINYNAYWNGTYYGRLAAGPYSGMVFTSAGDVEFRTAGSGAVGSNVGNTAHLIIANNGKVGISKNSTSAMLMPGDYSLYVETGIMTEKVKVAVKSTADWSDCVFDDNYNLLTFKELEDYIKENHHLPDVPSAGDVVKSGIDLGKMNAILLQKVEELTLYVLLLKECR